MPSWIYPALLTAWLVAFGAELAGIARWSASIASSRDAMERAGQVLAERAAQTNGAVREAAALSGEVTFLQGLPNLLPQDQSFLRTQKAVSDEVERLRAKVGRKLHGTLHVVIDAKANKLYLKKGAQLLWEADCSVGRGGVLRDRATGRAWEFVTPRGELTVLRTRENPSWIKPDWAFVEAGQPVPPPGDPSRLVPGELGAFLLNLGDGYLIHGTKDEASLGRAVSHGCVRLAAKDLENLYKTVPTGTKVFIIY
ncbi:MAG TPA: L,D-transpeptidase [Elusimicrobiota bacterium]|nr:L,D-transpeptidase [Elusimicrobiota bacterium]